MAFPITVARRVKQPALIALWGGSSSGKTYSALQLAYGMVEPGKKIGIIDTENRRGLMHVGAIPVDFFHIDLQPPFTADRYIEAFKSFEHAGDFGCIIVDSFTHCWEGEGGVIDQSEKLGVNGMPMRGLAKWAAPMIQLKRLTNTYLRAPMHVIYCMRQKMSYAQEKGGKGTVTPTGFVPIPVKNTIYEMGVSFWLGMDHLPIFRDKSETLFRHADIPAIKAPDAIMSQLVEGECLSVKHGKIIKKWFDGDVRDLADEGIRVAARGTLSLNAWFNSLNPEDRNIVIASNLGLKNIALKADIDEADRVATIERERLEQEAKQNGQSSDDGGNAFLDNFTPAVPAEGVSVAGAAEPAALADAPQGQDPSVNAPVPQAQAVIPKPDPAPIAPAPTPAPTTVPAASTPVAPTREQLIARFTNSLNTVDWFYQMADDGNAFKRGEQEVNALLSLARSLGPEFVAQFETKKAAMWRRTEPKATVAPQAEPEPQATSAPATARHVPTDTNPF